MDEVALFEIVDSDVAPPAIQVRAESPESEILSPFLSVSVSALTKSSHGVLDLKVQHPVSESSQFGKRLRTSSGSGFADISLSGA